MGRVRREDCLPCFLAVDVVRRVSRMRVGCFIVVFCGCIVYLALVLIQSVVLISLPELKSED